ncbi:MAG: hypothetical protein M1829_003433 [Trizodia sp. TS-e1964]|nr:MAG: hypothetical protein M1829_003433 [Trizodia sp. TS-e1964]
MPFQESSLPLPLGSSSPCLLESLPQEILDSIFISGMNPSLALSSRHLLTTLSSERNQKLLAVSMLSSDSGSVHTDILRRRFLTFQLYHSAVHAIQTGFLGNFEVFKDLDQIPDDFAYSGLARSNPFRHPAGTSVPIRLFRNIMDVKLSSGEFMKVIFIESVMFAAADFDGMRDMPGFAAAAQQSLEEAIEARNSAVVSVLVDDFLAPYPFATPTGAMVRAELEERDCENIEIAAYILRGYYHIMDYYPDQWQEWDGLKFWIRDREIRDKAKRSARGDHAFNLEGEPEGRRWIGCWLANFPITRCPYDQYVVDVIREDYRFYGQGDYVNVIAVQGETDEESGDGEEDDEQNAEEDDEDGI